MMTAAIKTTRHLPWDDTCRLRLGAACCTLAKLPKLAIKRTPMRTPLPLSSEAISTRQGTSMGLTHASLRLTNTFTGASVEVEALVDSGAMPLCIPESVARQLGFDTTEMYSARIKIADASRIDVPVVAPIRIHLPNRT